MRVAMRVLGINAIFHDPSAALIVDGQVVAAAEEERFSRRKHGKRPVPFSAWELPELAAAWCLESAGLRPGDLDAVAYSFDPGLCRDAAGLGLSDPWDHLRVDYARRAPQFLAAALPGLDPDQVRFVPHHVAHAASSGLAVEGDSAVLVLDGRGEVASHLAGVYRDGELTALAAQELPHSLGLLYEDLTRYLGFQHSSDEYKVMALASYGRPKFLSLFRELVHANDDGGFTVERIDWSALAKARTPDGEMTEAHADLASSVQTRLEEVMLDLARWTYDAAGGRVSTLTMAGGTALNCVANARIAAEGPFDRVWVHPGDPDTQTRMNDVKGREQFRPIAPMVRAERFDDIFTGVYPSPYMLFVHQVKPEWKDRIPAVTHVDGTARVQTVHAESEPLVAEMLAEFEQLTGLPVVVNTSLNTAGRPMVDTPREAMELFGSAPVDLLAMGPFAVHRAGAFSDGDRR